MARAQLINSMEVDGGTAWAVDADPAGAQQFTGSGRRWARFKVTRDGGARFEWQTGADRVREVARKLMGGQLMLDAALADPFVERWVDRRRDVFIATVQNRDPAVRDLAPQRLAFEMLLARGVRLTNASGPFAYYDEDDAERFLRDAAEALDPLPIWAAVRLADDGAPGTGFTAVSIWVEDGHDLRDLDPWLAGRDGGAR